MGPGVRVSRDGPRVISGALAGVLLISCQAAVQQAERPPQARQLHGQGKVHFVPLGGFPSDAQETLVSHFKNNYGVNIVSLPMIDIERVAFDPSRRQLVAEELISLMKRRHPTLLSDPEAILIGLTSGDMYLRSRPEWRFGFAAGELPRFAVISSARMEPVNLGDPPNPGQLQSRLRKMVVKYVGYMYFRLQQSSDRKTVMYGPILSVADLDSMGEDF